MEILKLTKFNHHGLSVKERIQKIIDDAKPMVVTWNQAKAVMNDVEDCQVYANSEYTVLYRDEKRVDKHKLVDEHWKGTIRYLSIKRNDKEPIHDWRDLQEIKNQICGEESEAIEIYPAESRLVDTANQYHLWVFPKGERIPVGYNTRSVIDEELTGENHTAKQRKRIC